MHGSRPKRLEFDTDSRYGFRLTPYRSELSLVRVCPTEDNLRKLTQKRSLPLARNEHLHGAESDVSRDDARVYTPDESSKANLFNCSLKLGSLCRTRCSNLTHHAASNMTL